MPDLPEATVTIDDEAGGLASGSDLLCIMAAVSTSADSVPRLYSSTKALLSFHGYSQGADFASLHIEETGLPVLFCGLPIVTAAFVAQQDLSQVDGTCTITVTGTPTDELDVELTITAGGTVGTDQVEFDLSLDGGRTTIPVHLGTATSYAVPYLGVTFNFPAGSTLEVDDAFTCITSPPRWGQAGLQAARLALAAQQLAVRSWLVIGDCAVKQDLTDIITQVNAYETSHDRFVYARAQVRDQRRAPKKARTRVKMTGGPSLTFAEVGATGDTITRATGSWVTDGFTDGMYITVSGTTSNNFSQALVTNVTATVLTLDTQDLVAETTSTAVVVGSTALTFAEVGATGDTITRATGSWLDDGFKVGDVVTVSGTASNNVTGAIASLSATVLTFDTTDLVAEVLGTHAVSITAPAESITTWKTSTDATFDNDGEKRIDPGRGRLRKASPITGWAFRRPVQWAATVREYQHDLHIPCWRKSDGPLPGWDLEDDDGTIVEYDARNDGIGRFTCARTWSNGPVGAFIALSLTRASESSNLSRTHNMAVTNLLCSIVQAETEEFVGESLVLKDDGTAEESSLVDQDSKVNSKIKQELLSNKRGEGPRASSASWRASRTDVLNVPGAEQNGTAALNLNGTIEKVRTRVKVQTAG